MKITSRERRVTHQIASLLLYYPDAEWLERFPLVRGAVRTLPRGIAAKLERFMDLAETKSVGRLASEYSATFDFDRRRSLYLSYYRCGDTRKRGPALVRFAQTYRAAGLVPPDRELPDHLAVVLEFSARAGEGAEDLLQFHRAEIELLALALRDAESPYAVVIEAVAETLPGPSPKDREDVVRMFAEGPPSEEVGIEPFVATPAEVRR